VDGEAVTFHMAVDALHNLDIWRHKRDDLARSPEGDPPLGRVGLKVSK
jgi:hypothetical protein